MKTSREEGEKSIKVTSDGVQIEPAMEFCYLGSLISDNTNVTKILRKG